MSPEFHLHLNSWSRDCDGRYDQQSDWVNPDANKRDHFQAVMDALAAVYQVPDDVLTITTWTEPHGEEGRTVFESHQETDEGFHTIGIIVCGDPCELMGYSQRDHAAEAMGY